MKGIYPPTIPSERPHAKADFTINSNKITKYNQQYNLLRSLKNDSRKKKKIVINSNTICSNLYQQLLDDVNVDI